ncbi:MAG: glycoside hydrolase family 57 protein [Sulfurimonas sp.]|uniref:glycoside hydrolase family 57 protein n=1 Tax=Sulfurimonas sp. TaxID=2022749 RepID=UPI0025E0AA8C|nr:glycoside hydrolase family 57 protein [Sulfurimonas sp.]MCK9490962.1 glycoside hydrolase family 57 protein [Sulfurimonas sp.]
MNLSFIWHMHQPDYRDATGIMQMPWVFLHAIKDYYDMPWMLYRHKGLKATFNITSPLISQLELYYNRADEHDKFLALWLSDPTLLDEESRAWILKICKSTQYDTMVKEFPRYKELYSREHFNNNDLLDIEVLFMLSWCGFYLRENSQVVKDLIQKQRDYDYEDKALLLRELSRFVSVIFDYYKRLHDEGVISISTTPLNHPILPLLLDMKNAVYANSSTNIPKDHISLADDAALQVIKSKELFLKTFGFTPDGFWPAEGSVDEKTVALLSEHGIKWIATDEAILFKSINSYNRDNLYKTYQYKEMCMGFRDHYLSDLIGFSYRHQEAISATNNFINELQKIENKNNNNTVFIILDGENAWEFYKNNGFDFFDALYGKLNNLSWCKTLTMDEVYELDKTKLEHLAPGSWINGEFNTWVGHNEKTRAWELIYVTKKDYQRHKETLSDETKAKISEHFLSAECSDWFWWYGDDHFTEFGVEFDELFRNHLIEIYELMNLKAPTDIFIPILEDKSVVNFWLKPQSHISPHINGKHDSFFEWIGCGVIDESKLFSTMDRQRGPIRKILYGQDNEKIYISFLAKRNKMSSDDFINVAIEPLNVKARLAMKSQKTFIGPLEVEVAFENVFELSIDKKLIEDDSISLIFEVEQDEKIIQSLPGFGELKIDLGNDYSKNWFI